MVHHEIPRTRSDGFVVGWDFMPDLLRQYSPSFQSFPFLSPSAQWKYHNLAVVLSAHCTHWINSKKGWSQRHFLQRLFQLMFLSHWYCMAFAPQFLQICKLLFFLAAFTPIFSSSHQLFFLPSLSLRCVTAFYPKYILLSFNATVLFSDHMIVYSEERNFFFLSVPVKWARWKFENSQHSRQVCHYQCCNRLIWMHQCVHVLSTKQSQTMFIFQVARALCQEAE